MTGDAGIQNSQATSVSPGVDRCRAFLGRFPNVWLILGEGESPDARERIISQSPSNPPIPLRRKLSAIRGPIEAPQRVREGGKWCGFLATEGKRT